MNKYWKIEGYLLGEGRDRDIDFIIAFIEAKTLQDAISDVETSFRHAVDNNPQWDSYELNSVSLTNKTSVLSTPDNFIATSLE